MPTSGQLPEAFFWSVICLLLAVVVFVGLYWVVRWAVRDALEDTDKRRSGKTS